MSSVVRNGYDYLADFYYKAGDSFTVKNIIRTAGYISASKTGISFFLPLSKPIEEGVTVSVENMKLIFRQNQNYLYGSTSGTGVEPNSVSINTNENGITFIATYDADSNAENNAPLGVDICANTIINFN